jgi:hypothetical protein
MEHATEMGSVTMLYTSSYLKFQSVATCSRWFLARGFFYPEDGADMFLRNVSSQKIYTAPHPRRRHSSSFVKFGSGIQKPIGGRGYIDAEIGRRSHKPTFFKMRKVDLVRRRVRIPPRQPCESLKATRKEPVAWDITEKTCN